MAQETFNAGKIAAFTEMLGALLGVSPEEVSERLAGIDLTPRTPRGKYTRCGEPIAVNAAGYERITGCRRGVDHKGQHHTWGGLTLKWK